MILRELELPKPDLEKNFLALENRSLEYVTFY